jgi:hypothetical protein
VAAKRDDDSRGEPEAPMSLERALDVAERVMAAEAASEALGDVLESEAARAAERAGPGLDGGAPSAGDAAESEARDARERAQARRAADPQSPPGADSRPPPEAHRPADRRGAPRAKVGRRSGAPAARSTTEAQKVRNPFGTRVARKVICGVCGAEDTIHFAPRGGQTPLCRRCAAERLGVIDREANIAPEQREKCERCGLYVRKPCRFEDPLDCPEHARALAFRQRDRARTGTRAKKNVVRVRKKP